MSKLVPAALETSGTDRRITHDRSKRVRPVLTVVGNWVSCQYPICQNSYDDPLVRVKVSDSISAEEILGLGCPE